MLNPDGELQIIDYSNSPFARPDMRILVEGAQRARGLCHMHCHSVAWRTTDHHCRGLVIVGIDERKCLLYSSRVFIIIEKNLCTPEVVTAGLQRRRANLSVPLCFTQCVCPRVHCCELVHTCHVGIRFIQETDYPVRGTYGRV